MIDFVNTPALTTNQDIIFHMSIRPHENVIVRNHFQNGKWGQEERSGGETIRANEIFEIIILAEREFYKIAVNGHHIGDFRHRLPLYMVQYVNVKGDATIDYILVEENIPPPYHQPIGVDQTTTPSAPFMPNIPTHFQIQTPMQSPMQSQQTQPSGFPQQHQNPVSRKDFALIMISLFHSAVLWESLLKVVRHLNHTPKYVPFIKKN